jgi:hypothetical protein
VPSDHSGLGSVAFALPHGVRCAIVYSLFFSSKLEENFEVLKEKNIDILFYSVFSVSDL